VLLKISEDGHDSSMDIAVSAKYESREAKNIKKS
jgi:hypothetical protein